MKRIIAFGVLLAALAACNPAPKEEIVAPINWDAQIIASASQALPEYEWDAESEMYFRIVWDDDMAIGMISYSYEADVTMLFLMNLTPYSNTSDQDNIVWLAWDDLTAFFLGEEFLEAMLDWEASIAAGEIEWPQENVINGRDVILDMNSDGEAFIMARGIEVSEGR